MQKSSRGLKSGVTENSWYQKIREYLENTVYHCCD